LHRHPKISIFAVKPLSFDQSLTRFAALILVAAAGARCNDGCSFFSDDVFWQGKDAGGGLGVKLQQVWVTRFLHLWRFVHERERSAPV